MAKRYTIFPNSIYENEKLSDVEKLIVFDIYYNNKDFIYTKKYFQIKFKISYYEKIQRFLKKLEKLEIIKINYLTNKDIHYSKQFLIKSATKPFKIIVERINLKEKKIKHKEEKIPLRFHGQRPEDHKESEWFKKNNSEPISNIGIVKKLKR